MLSDPTDSFPGSTPPLTGTLSCMLPLGPVLRSTWPREQWWSWHGAGAGQLGKDIDEDLTGGVPKLSIGVDTLEQRLPQWLRRVGP